MTRRTYHVISFILRVTNVQVANLNLFQPYTSLASTPCMCMSEGEEEGSVRR